MKPTERAITASFSQSVAAHGAIAIVLVIAFGMMAFNAVQHPVKMLYDLGLHSECLAVFNNHSLSIQPLPNVLSYNSPIYYYVIGKLAAWIGGEPILVGRALHFVFVLVVALLITYSLLPRLFDERAPAVQLFFALAAFAVPGFFLTQVMLRTDHILQFALYLLLFCWYRYDWRERLACSFSAQITWAVLLILLANTRQIAFPVFCVFFLWGLWILVKTQWRLPEGVQPRRWAVGGLILVVVALSGLHYAHRYWTTGKIGMKKLAKYQQRMKEPEFSRLKMLTNVQFDVMWQTPNRTAEYDGGQMDVALWPRLYNDMWGDFWLYYSGPERSVDDKVAWKRIMFIAGIPYTLLLIGSVLYCGALGAWKAVRLRGLEWYEAAGLLCVLGVGIYLLAVFLYPRPGKVTLAKFAYAEAFFWAGVLCMTYVASRSRGALLAALVIAGLTFLLAIPLSLYSFNALLG